LFQALGLLKFILLNKYKITQRPNQVSINMQLKDSAKLLKSFQELLPTTLVSKQKDSSQISTLTPENLTTGVLTSLTEK
jgi:hypothetical protein